MDISAALSAAEVAALGDADRPCEEATRQLEHAAGKRKDVEGTFEESLRLKNTLDTFEETGMKTRIERQNPGADC